MPVITALISGILFGLGLLVAGMGNPQKILAFLDITGNWDPSLQYGCLYRGQKTQKDRMRHAA